LEFPKLASVSNECRKGHGPRRVNGKYAFFDFDRMGPTKGKKTFSCAFRRGKGDGYPHEIEDLPKLLSYYFPW
jgi:hypothetical protein